MREEDKLDCLLAQEAGELPPPPEVEREITPWRRAMHRIVWGIGLTTCTLNVWNLDTAMLMVGTVMLWLGFRALRRENRWFTACWGISLIEVVFRLAVFILNATTTWGAEYSHGWLTYFVVLLPLVQYVCLWQAIKEVRRRAGQPAEARAAGALIWFYLVLTALALLNVQGLIFVVAILVIYILILRSLSKFSNLLDEAGYQVQPALVRISDRSIWILWCVALLVCITTAPILFGRYPMEWSPRPEGEQAGLEEIRANLVELGMPEQVADDLSPEDLSAMEGAIQVEVFQDEMSFPLENWGEICLGTNLAVKLPGGRWKIIHHFQWQTGPRYRTTECIAVSAADPGGYHMEELLTGRLLYDRDGTTYVGDYYRLSLEKDRPTALAAADRQQGMWPVALFSLPLRGENCRGYLMYEVKALVGDGYMLYSYMNYTHQISLWNYPLETAQQQGGQGIMGDESKFQISSSALQFFPNRTN